MHLPLLGAFGLQITFFRYSHPLAIKMWINIELRKKKFSLTLTFQVGYICQKNIENCLCATLMIVEAMSEQVKKRKKKNDVRGIQYYLTLVLHSMESTSKICLICSSHAACCSTVVFAHLHFFYQGEEEHLLNHQNKALWYRQ